MGRYIEIHLGVGAVEADDHGQWAIFQQREEMDADVAEEDVEHLGVASLHGGEEVARFGAVDGDRTPEQLFLDEPPELVGARFGEDFEIGEWKLFGVLALLAKDDGAEGAEAGDLPIDVEHLRLEEGDDVLDGDREGGGIRWRSAHEWAQQFKDVAEGDVRKGRVAARRVVID